jgi:hypothetical protein
MSDISSPTAPADVAPPQPPTEVTIPDQGPQGGSGETGQQTTPKTHEMRQWEKAAQRRGAIERAFEKSRAAQAAKNEGQEKSESRSAKGPDSTEKPPERHPNRGEGGRFAAAQPVAGSTPSSDSSDASGRPAGQQPSRYVPLAETAPYREPPPRFDDGAKADWHGAPESVRAATTKAFQQYERGIHQYRQAAEAFHQVRDYHEMAAQTGQNLRQVLQNYHGMEQRLRQDLFGGVDLIINNLGHTKRDGSRYTVRDFAADVLRLSPDQHRLTQQQNVQHAQHLQTQRLHQTVERLATGFQQMQYHQRFSHTLSEVDRFAASHPGFDERSDLIKAELDHGYPLHVAYDRAMKLRPGNGATHAAQTRNAPAQTRDDIDRSISGAPTNGSVHPSQRQKPSSSNREALAKALKRVRAGA